MSDNVSIATEDHEIIPGKGKVRIVRNREKSLQTIRLIIQILFAALCVWIGIETFLFVKFLESGGVEKFVSRPPGVEGFLPISSLMSLYYFFLTAEIHPAHPAGFFILAAILVMSLVFGKTFCSWLCPVGLLSESLGDLGQKLFRRKITLPRWLDYPLRSLKYLLLAFFVYSIFFLMTTASLKVFLDSPYNVTADIKMYYFFAEITPFALTVLLALVVLSIPIRGFWCRFLCPYGGLLGSLSLLSPYKIKRNVTSCIECAKCAKVCPSFIKVDKVSTVVSDECHTCLACVDICPVADTLQIKSPFTRKTVSKRLVAIVTVAIFLSVTGFAMLTGNWQNDITKEEYLIHQPHLKGYGHPTGTNDISELNKSSQLQNQNRGSNKK